MMIKSTQEYLLDQINNKLIKLIIFYFREIKFKKEYICCIFKKK